MMITNKVAERLLKAAAVVVGCITLFTVILLLLIYVLTGISVDTYLMRLLWVFDFLIVVIAALVFIVQEAGRRFKVALVVVGSITLLILFLLFILALTGIPVVIYLMGLLWVVDSSVLIIMILGYIALMREQRSRGT